LLKYHLHNDLYLQKVQCPVTLFHGTEDEIIPYDSSETLEKINPEQIQLVSLEGVSHRGAIFNTLFGQTMSRLLRSF